jgi:sugar O-acyltransferase (sialic acid O-acetyltransferase NeuD family)
MILYGAGGHAKVVCNTLENLNIFIDAIFEDIPSINFSNGKIISKKYDPNFLPNVDLIIAIGSNQLRKNISTKIKHPFGKCIAKSSVVDLSVEIGDGTVVMHNSVIQSSSKIGRHCIINTSASIDHDSIIHDFVHISPGVTLCGNVNVDEGTHIGAGSTVIPNIKIGKWCVIGAGTVIVNDIPDYSMVLGVPGKIKNRISSND